MLKLIRSMVIILDSTNFYVTTIFICSFYINTNGAVVRMGAVVPLLYWDMNLKNGTKKIALKFFGHRVWQYLNEGSDHSNDHHNLHKDATSVLWVHSVRYVGSEIWD